MQPGSYCILAGSIQRGTANRSASFRAKALCVHITQSVIAKVILIPLCFRTSRKVRALKLASASIWKSNFADLASVLPCCECGTGPFVAVRMQEAHQTIEKKISVGKTLRRRSHVNTARRVLHVYICCQLRMHAHAFFGRKLLLDGKIAGEPRARFFPQRQQTNTRL